MYNNNDHKHSRHGNHTFIAIIPSLLDSNELEMVLGWLVVICVLFTLNGAPHCSK